MKLIRSFKRKLEIKRYLKGFKGSKLFDLEKHAIKTNIDLMKRKDVKISSFTYGHPNVRTGGGYYFLEVGKFCMFGPNVSIHLTSNHHAEWITAYDFSWILGKKTKELLIEKGNVIIQNDVWIGQNVIILPGVTIGDGSIVAAGSIVTKSIPPYSVVAGVPAKIIKQRFEKETIEKLLEIKWWNWSDYDIFSSIPFLESQDVDSLYTYWLKNIKNNKK